MGENYITYQVEKGSINISEEVVYTMAKAALGEVEGVAGLSNTTGAELAELIGLKTMSKGIKVQFIDGRIIVDVIINVLYGSNIVNVAKNVQEKLMTIVQATTGIDAAEVNVHVSGIALDNK